MKTRGFATLSFVLLAVTTALPQDASRAVLTRPFDAPAKTKVVDLGPSAYHPGTQRVRNKLSCYWYPTVMVREYDEGQKGAEWLSFVAIKAHEQPECTPSHMPDEKFIGKSDESEWVGYFRGVKGNFVFFVDADGLNGGLRFAVCDSRTGKKIFEDSEYC